jgi:lysophospholipid hydrolase
MLFWKADCVMVVGMGDDPGIGEYERLLLSMKTTARKELVLLHPHRSIVPGSTRAWLKVSMKIVDEMRF